MYKDNNYILNSKAEAEKMLLGLKKQIAKLKVKPTLAVILVGHDPASKIYVAIKEKRAKDLGVIFQKHLLPASITEKKIIALIQKLNADKKITAILLQLPLPKKFKTNTIIQEIGIWKDVDGLKFFSVIPTEEPSRARREVEESKKRIPRLKATKVAARDDKGGIISPTIQSIIHLIKLSKQKLANKKAIILCHSQEFAEPLRQELRRQKIKVEVYLACVIPAEAGIQKEKILDSQSCSGMTKKADIIIVTLGKKHFLKPAMLKKDAIIIDVGINRVGKKIFGDVDPSCLIKTKYISPVPGGVGPLTVAYLFKNLLKLKNPS